jgi:hypothetical protein|tara:strand:- start:95 stop:268 length:174 start_codon:yes stop_codon:yes gene_type:complete
VKIENQSSLTLLISFDFSISHEIRASAAKLRDGRRAGRAIENPVGRLTPYPSRREPV